MIKESVAAAVLAALIVAGPGPMTASAQTISRGAAGGVTVISAIRAGAPGRPTSTSRSYRLVGQDGEGTARRRPAARR